jgi:hypothetical protein
LWIAGENDPTIRPVVRGEPLLTLRTGAPVVHISNARLLGGLKIEGGELELIDCIIEPDDSANGQDGGAGRRLTPSASERPLSIDGGLVSLTRATLHGHTSGAIIVRAASLSLIQSSLQGNRAPHGGAILVTDGSVVRVERCSLTDNAADANGGALQVRSTLERQFRIQVATLYLYLCLCLYLYLHLHGRL